MDISAAIGVLQGLVQAEGGSSGNASRSEVSNISATLLSAEEMSANGESFWQASADANVSINALSRCGRLPWRLGAARYLLYIQMTEAFRVYAGALQARWGALTTLRLGMQLLCSPHCWPSQEHL